MGRNWDDDPWGQDRSGRSSRRGEQDDRPAGRSPRGGSGFGPSPRYGRDDYDENGGRSGGGYGGRSRGGSAAGSARGGGGRMPPPRDDYDDYRPRSRAAGPAAPPRGNGYPQQRRPAPQGGLWDDEDRVAPPRRPRSPQGQMGGPRGAGYNQRDPRDPRVRQAAAAPEKKGISFGAAFGIIVLMFVLGGAAAFGVFTLTKPQVNAELVPTATPATQDTTPSASPSANPTATKTSYAPGSSAFVLIQRADLTPANT